MRHGVLITFEGADGTGKSTQIKLLQKKLRKVGVKAFVTREPGGSALGEKLRGIITSLPCSTRAELLLFEASRAEHVEKVLQPRLRRGEVVLCDRYAESSLVYQGIVRKLGLDLVRKANEVATGGLRSQYIILLEAPSRTARSRMNRRGRLDRFEKESASFHSKVQKAFAKLAKSDKRFRRYSTELNRAMLSDLILNDLLKFLKASGHA